MLQIQQQQIKFVPFGLFEINLGLFSMVKNYFKIYCTFRKRFLQIFGAIVTYILILIQFDVAQKT